MTGFVRRLFGSKPEDASAAAQEKKRQSSSGGYFLDEDSAKSLGNVEYMRTAKTVRRTFPKTAGSPEEMEQIKLVSSMSAAEVSKYEAEAAAAKAAEAQAKAKAPTQTSPTSSGAAADRRRNDSSMDIFRNMAKDIRKP